MRGHEAQWGLLAAEPWQRGSCLSMARTCVPWGDTGRGGRAGFVRWQQLEPLPPADSVSAPLVFEVGAAMLCREVAGPAEVPGAGRCCARDRDDAEICPPSSPERHPYWAPALKQHPPVLPRESAYVPIPFRTLVRQFVPGDRATASPGALSSAHLSPSSQGGGPGGPSLPCRQRPQAGQGFWQQHG